jgi:hypothetical protein
MVGHECSHRGRPWRGRRRTSWDTYSLARKWVPSQLDCAPAAMLSHVQDTRMRDLSEGNGRQPSCQSEGLKLHHDANPLAKGSLSGGAGGELLYHVNVALTLLSYP